MKRFFRLLSIGFLLVLAVAIGRGVLLPSRQIKPIPHTPEKLDSVKLARDLSSAVKFPSVSWELGGTEEQRRATSDAFVGLHDFLQSSFPLTYSRLAHETIGRSNLLFTWKGIEPTLKPILLMAHQDVVPSEADTEAEWTHGPFSGDISDGFIWGRGTLDDKMSVVGLLEAVETLLAQGYQPKRTIYLAFGQDEEIGGEEGAVKIAEVLKSRGVSLEFVLDEGGFVTVGTVPGVGRPVAIVGTSEKGYLSLELTVETEGGHSSMPPRETSIGILSRAVSEIEKHPQPAHLRGPDGEFLEFVSGGASQPMKIVFRNLWLFGPVLERVLQRSPTTNATLRTTTAPTILEAGTKDNVLASKAKAIVNFRILPGDTVAEVTERVRNTVNDARVKIQPLPGEPPTEASTRSRTDSVNFATMQTTIAQVFPDAIVAPYVSVGATDARHYAGLTNDIYRFAPLLLKAEDIGRLHNRNERVSVENFVRSIDFYIQLMRNATQ